MEESDKLSWDILYSVAMCEQNKLYYPEEHRLLLSDLGIHNDVTRVGQHILLVKGLRAKVENLRAGTPKSQWL